jgi:PAS domain S-box-containing protein
LKQEYRILLVEDSPSDAALIRGETRKVMNPCRCLTVETREAFTRAVDEFNPDAILSEFTLPDFDGLSAMRIALEKSPLVPILIVTGSTDEGAAVKCLKAGAADFILKERIHRLGPALLDALRRKYNRIRSARIRTAHTENEERFRTLTENVEDVIYRYALLPRRGFTYVSPAVTNIIGYSPADHYADPDLWLKIIHPADAKRYHRYLAEWFQNAAPISLRWINKDGSVVWTEQRNIPVRDDIGRLVAFEGIARDRTARNKTEQSLLDSEERYRSLFENDPAGDFIAGADGEIISCNRAFSAMLGLRKDGEAGSLNLFQFCQNVEQHEGFLRAVGERRRVERYDLDLTRLDGKTVYAAASAHGVFDPAGGLSRIVGFLVDETERRQLEQQLVQAQKLESLGTLAGGIAHDFNNILGIILGYLTLLEETPSMREESPMLKVIQKAAQRGVDLVKQLLTFSRKNEPHFGPVLLHEAANEVIKLLKKTFPKTILLENYTNASLPPVTADATQLHLAFLNLCLNARDAMQGGGILSIAGGKINRHSLAARHPGADARKYAFIRITDTGLGMSETIKKRIFEPFFTTKGKEAGTGLGLSLVHEIITRHRGFIDVESVPGGGTNFTVYLPARDENRLRGSPAEPVPESVVGGNETILVVEDEETLRDYLAIVLQSRGYNVLTAADGEEGVVLFQKHQSEIKVVLSDFGLPKLDGGGLFRRIQSCALETRMILMSGSDGPGIKSLLQQAGIKFFLQKPFSSDVLLKTIRKAIEATG